MARLKLFMLLLGCKPPGRHIEQHDVFFGIAGSLSELVPEIKAFWPEPEKIHIDAWREVTAVDGYQINIINKGETNNTSADLMMRLFFVNLGGYQPDKFEEQHYVILTAKKDRAAAFKASKETLFFRHNHFEGASSHIDDKYGIDVDDLYQIEDILSDSQKEKYQIELTPMADLSDDQINLGYFKLDRLP
ncbi:uncharacterized protein DUF1543 [Mucilaginibacter frigoritolerans]|jgi:hypothetical protein|uniref:Uncharacterized protein DUF1543 n=2 Tax=Mucilaginibacter frigoritolerans TaxID=652788 RepID=A0A562U537_9SPHI|nr:uncharacterized protein DUF1543 [Mucilaginibacter frigoritolerans]